MFPAAREVRLSPVERAELEGRLRAPTAAQRDVLRARIVLMAAEGLATRAIARDLGTMPRTVSLWRIRFAEAGLAGLADQPRPGGRSSAKYDETTDRRILAVLDGPPPAGYGRWTGGLVAEALGDVSDQYVWRFLRAHKIDLDGRKSWCVSHDPEFVGLSGILCAGPVAPSRLNEPFVEHDGELGLCLEPLARRHFPFPRGLAQDQKEELGRCLVGWKMASGFNGAA
jgi:transposase